MADQTMTKLRIAVVACVWLGILGIGVLAYKFWWAPQQEKQKQEQAVAEHQQTIDKTGSNSKYTTSVSFAGDAFSGYAPIRSQTFKDECGKYGIRIDYTDDGANYTKRLKDLADGKLDMAVFTYDALIKTSAELGDFPATIVGLIDESKGADAMVAAGKRYPNIDAMNNPETKIVCVGNSPSEMLTRLIMSYFSLDKLSKDCFEFCDSEEAVYKKYQQSKPTDNRVFVLWEPYVSKVCQNPDYHILVDSSKFRGYIVDVIVVRRGFLVKNEQTVENVVKAYLTTVFAKRNEMLDLVLEDAKITGEPLKRDQAERLVKSIWWKNTQETFGHFGFAPASGLQSMEDMGRNITDVLVRTGAISKDPTNGKPTMWYYDAILKRLFDSSWHPGFGPETVREEKKLLALTDQEWAKLKPVGTLQVQRLVFSRGTSNITTASETTLTDLAEKLKAWPQYYLIVRGNASSDGDVDANLKLASARANSAVEWLVEHGVDRNRIRAESAKPNGSTTVAFILGELPY
jgi:outer membrane protein OmpA-like peptidoglycan-associated protein